MEYDEMSVYAIFEMSSRIPFGKIRTAPLTVNKLNMLIPLFMSAFQIDGFECPIKGEIQIQTLNFTKQTNLIYLFTYFLSNKNLIQINCE